MIPIYRIVRWMLLGILFPVSFIATAQQNPIPDWVKDLGNAGNSMVTGIALDKDDNIYVSGSFSGSLIIDKESPDPVNLVSKGEFDVFIAKYTVNGRLIWARSFGGQTLDQCNSLAIDKKGNAYIAIQYNSNIIDVDPGPGEYLLEKKGYEAALLVKISTDGNFLWAKQLAGDQARGHSVTTDQQDNVVFVGTFIGSEVQAGNIVLSSKGQFDGFMVKYTEEGIVMWAQGYGSQNDDEVKNVKVNSNNEILVMGYFYGELDVNPAGASRVLQHSGSQDPDNYIAKYSSSGTLIWANTIAGSGAKLTSSIAIGPQNDVYLTGAFSQTFKLNSPSRTFTLEGVGRDLFVAKYNNAGEAIWAESVEALGSGNYSYYISADVEDNIYIAGFFEQKIKFGTGTTQKTLTAAGERDIFFAKFAGTGGYLWAFGYGNDCGGNFGHKIAVDSRKNVILGGRFCGTVDFNTDICKLEQTANSGSYDGFLAKYNQVKFTGDAAITSFKFQEQEVPEVIDVANQTVRVVVAPGVDPRKLSPVVFTDIGDISPKSEEERDFSRPVTYTITSNCKSYVWTVYVTVDPSVLVKACSKQTRLLTGETNTDIDPVYLWQFERTPGVWETAEGIATEANYEFEGAENLTTGIIQYRFRRQKTVSNVVTYDPTFRISVFPVAGNNVINTLQRTYCNGTANVTIQGTVPTNADATPPVYQWEFSENSIDWQIFANQTGKDLTPTLINSSMYFRRAATIGNCVYYSNELKIVVMKAISQAFAGNNVRVCKNSTVTLDARPAGSDETGKWSVVSPAGYMPFTTANIGDPNATITDVPADVEVVLQWTISVEGCNFTSQSQVTIINFNDPVLTLPPVITVQKNSGTQLPAAVSNSIAGAYRYFWTSSEPLSNPNILNPTIASTRTATYHLTIEYGANCSYQSSVTAVVETLVKIAVCTNDQQITFTGDVFETGAAFQWQKLVSGNWTDVEDATGKDLLETADENFTNDNIVASYRRKVTIPTATYYDSEHELTLFAKTKDNMISTAQVNFCASGADNVMISGNTPTGAANLPISYTWQSSVDGSNWTSIPGDQMNLTVHRITVTTFYRRVTSTNGCEVFSNAIVVNIFPAPVFADAGADVYFCNVSEVRLNGNVPGSNETGTWKVISPAGYQPFTGAEMNNPNAVLHNFPQNTDVILSWTIENRNCNTFTTDEVKFHSYEEIVITGERSHTIYLGEPANFNLSANLYPGSNSQISWSPEDGLSAGDVLSPDFNPDRNTTYTLTIRYGINCEAKTTVKVIVLNGIEVPRSITPNLDGINDTWTIKNISNYTKSRVTIFNRYGTTVYAAQGTTAAWDGTNRGQRLPVGTYYYVIELNDRDRKIFKGSITLLY